MQVKQPLGKDRHRNHAANQDGPHEQAALLDVVDHGILFLVGFGACGKPVGSLAYRRRGVGVGFDRVPGVRRITFPAALKTV
jgi:hypothetical protein